MQAVVKQLAKTNLLRQLDWNAIAEEIGGPHGEAAFRRWGRFQKTLQGSKPKALRVGVQRPRDAPKQQRDGENGEKVNDQVDNETAQEPKNGDATVAERAGEEQTDASANRRRDEEDKQGSDDETDSMPKKLQDLEVDSDSSGISWV